MENADLFNFLKGELENKGIDSSSYEEYWESLTKHERSPCPLCFTQKGVKSSLMPLPEKGGFEPVKCEVCKEIFYKPIP
ncbi:hypothetical protein [Sulfuriflexus mobilis]|uniref:hypothetical protein n=1 Tax=Sulfuriflexus mobilis TaxID=1811807 RepID=UPI000F82B035|nr:hypothetical protein [Sulfuriflexus mobilis]